MKNEQYCKASNENNDGNLDSNMLEEFLKVTSILIGVTNRPILGQQNF